MIARLRVLRRHRRRRPDHLGRAAAHAPADGARGQGPGHRPLRVDRLHLGQRRARRPREVRGVRARRPRVRRAQDRRRRRGHRRRRCASGASSPTSCPPASSRRTGLLEEWPPFDEVLDPINRVFLPRADIATDTLVAGLQEMGWEVDDVTAYRTVRAAPPAAPIREAIKSGQFDAVGLHLVLDGAQPGRHRRQAAPVHGRSRASARRRPRRPRSTACGSTSSRPRPSADALVDALADYGLGLALAAAEAGEPRRAAQRQDVRVAPSAPSTR